MSDDQPPTKKRKNNAPSNDDKQVFCEDVLINILSFVDSMFVIGSGMLVSQDWKKASSQVKLSIQLHGCDCIIDEEEEEEEEEEDEDKDSFNLKVFCKCPNIANTTILDLEYNEMDGTSTKWIARSEFLHNLEEIYLNNCSIGSEGISHLVSDDSCLKKLKLLHLEKSEIGSEGAKLLANSPTMSNLTSIDLYSNDIGNEGFKHICNSKYLKKLTHLDLSNNEINDISCISSTENFGLLKSLSLCQNIIGLHGLESLKKCSLPKLEDLSFNSCEIGLEDFKTIIDWPLLSQLKNLELIDNELDKNEIQELKSLIGKKHPHLREVIKFTQHGMAV